MLVQCILQRFPKQELKPFAWKEYIDRDTTMSRDNRVYPSYLLCSLKILGDYNPSLYRAYIGISHTLTLAVWPFAGHHVARRVRTESTSSGAASGVSLGVRGKPWNPKWTMLSRHWSFLLFVVGVVKTAHVYSSIYVMIYSYIYILIDRFISDPKPW